MKEIISSLRGYIFKIKCKLFYKRIRIGKHLKIYKAPRVNCKGYIVIGDRCSIGGIKGDAVQCTCLDTFTVNSIISIGNDVALFGARLSSRHSIAVGDSVLIEESGIIDTDFHSLDTDRKTPIEDTKSCHVVVGKRVSIGARSLLTKGVKIGDDAVIFPGSIVKNSVPAGCIVCGNPARRLKYSDVDVVHGSCSAQGISLS